MVENLTDKPIPLYSVDLIKELEELVSTSFPELTDDDRTIGAKIGQRNLVNALKARLKITDEGLTKG